MTVWGQGMYPVLSRKKTSPYPFAGQTLGGSALLDPGVKYSREVLSNGSLSRAYSLCS
jgi:hypothetical protein